MTGHNESRIDDNLLAAVLSQADWRSNRMLYALLIKWLHEQFGLAWQSVIYSGTNFEFEYLNRVYGLVLFLDKSSISRIEVISDKKTYRYSTPSIDRAQLAQLVWYAKSVTVHGLPENHKLQLQSALNNSPSVYSLDTESGLFAQLMKEFSDSRKKSSRNKKLWRKLKKDPVLFFKDSKSLSGRSVYAMIRMLRLEQSV